ncbi:MAG TPA: VanW family protein [Desulfitobacteriaceae bacterium]|nr:VanW family protein [Desulfitobacteriaceae bacterium]
MPRINIWYKEKYILLLLAVLLFLIGLYLSVTFLNSGKFFSDVRIGGIAVGGCDRVQALEALEGALAKVKSIPVSFYKDDYIYQAQLGDLIMPVDLNSLVESAWQNEQKRNWYSGLASINLNHKVEYPVNFSYNPQKVAELMQVWDKKLGRTTKDAYLEIDGQGLLVIKEQAGEVINESATFQTLPASLAESGEIRLPIAVERQEPKITAAMLQDMVQLSVYSTYYNTAEKNRSHNLGLAATSINKSLVKPGEVFSYNGTVGPRTPERGYLEAKIIVGNKYESGLGGGICQVSSTLYNAVLLAGLGIMERYYHNLAVAYVPMGRDATVDYGHLDFKFQNNTAAPVYVRSISQGGKLTVSIYGNAKYKQKIEITNVVNQTIPFNTITENDSTLEPGEQKVVQEGKPGYKVSAFRSTYDPNGKLITTEQLSQDFYQPLDKLILVGPEIVSPLGPPGTKDPKDPKTRSG